MLQMLEKIIRRTTRFIPIPHYGIKNVKKALIIAPHMDDDIVGCGGIMRLLSQGGTEFHIVYVTNGCRGNSSMQYDGYLGEIRKAEAEAAVNYLIEGGNSRLFYLDMDDNSVSDHISDTGFMQILFMKEKYDAVFVPYILDIHPDHRAANYLLLNTLEQMEISDKIRIFFYEVWVPLIPNLVVDITSCFEDKCKAMQFHRSQTATKQYVYMIRNLNGYRASFANRDEIMQAEAFYQCSMEEYVYLVREVKTVCCFNTVS